MEWSEVVRSLLSQCGILTTILGIALTYQTWRLGREREECDDRLEEADKRATEARETVSRVMSWMMTARPPRIS